MRFTQHTGIYVAKEIRGMLSMNADQVQSASAGNRRPLGILTGMNRREEVVSIGNRYGTD